MTIIYTTTIFQDEHMNATGIPVPEEVMVALSAKKRPPVVVTLGAYSYRTTVAVMGGEFMLPLSAEHRRAAGVVGGQTLEVGIALDTEPRLVVLPDDLKAALEAAHGALAAYQASAPSTQKEFVRQVASAKAAATRERRIAKIVALLSPG